MAIEAERVVVMVDASREINPSSIGAALHGLPLKAGDKFIIVGALHQITNPSTLSLKAALMGYIGKVEPGSILSVSRKFVDEEVVKKKEEYLRDDRLKQVSMQCQIRKIEFQIEVQAGPSPKVVAVTAARSFRATWLVIDRQMKRDKKYLMDKVLCGIARVKSNNQIELLRIAQPNKVESCSLAITRVKSPTDEAAPPAVTTTKTTTRSSRRSSDRRSRASFALFSITYGEMVEGSSDDEEEENVFPRKIPISKIITTHTDSESFAKGGVVQVCSSHGFRKSTSSDYLTTTRTSTSSYNYPDNSSISTNLESKSSSVSNLAYQETTTSATDTETPHENRYSPSSGTDHNPIVTKTGRSIGRVGLMDEVFSNSVCSVCNNRRPKIGLTGGFTFAELQIATRNFAQENFLSEGGFGSVYEGEFGGLKIAVKLHKSASFQGEKEFTSEVEVLSKARHENLVMLLGSCSERNQRLLVYEFVCNGSLDQHLSEKANPPLTWEKRMKIALGAAKGLQYLHENNIIHRDMRPNNILVTHDFEPLLGDFGLAKTQLEDSDNSADQTRVVGTLGYLAPEYAEYGKVSSKTDVYAFGVVLLQLITGKKTTDEKLGGRSLVGWARPLLKERNYPDLIDQRIVDSHDVHQLFWMVRVAEKCLSKDPHKRLPMNTVVLALSCVMEGKSVSSIKDFSPAHSSAAGSVGEGELTDSPCDDVNGTTCRQTHYCKRRMLMLPPPSPTNSTSSVQLLSCSAPEEIDEDYYFDYII